MHQRIPRNDWDRAPWNRWSFQNVRQLVPTVEVWRGNDQPWMLQENYRALDKLTVELDKAPPFTINDWLDESYTDGFIVLHHGSILFERYMNGMSARTLHLSQSVAKSIVGTVAGILIGRGSLSPSEQVTSYLPELNKTAWKGATIQQVMDMTTGVRFVEDYEALDSDIAMTDFACGWKIPAHGVDAPECMWDQILSLTDVEREHGELFVYRSIETDVLAHCLERITGLRLAELVSHELWQPLGCEESACFTVDRAGYALADGGFNATLRDYARFGQMHLQRGFANGRQIVPTEWVRDISNADAGLFRDPYNRVTPNGAYRNQFWLEDVSTQASMARGVFGQLIYIDPDHDFVAVKLSSWPEFTSEARLRATLKALDAIKQHLVST